MGRGQQNFSLHPLRIPNDIALPTRRNSWNSREFRQFPIQNSRRSWGIHVVYQVGKGFILYHILGMQNEKFFLGSGFYY